MGTSRASRRSGTPLGPPPCANSRARSSKRSQPGAGQLVFWSIKRRPYTVAPGLLSSVSRPLSTEAMKSAYNPYHLRSLTGPNESDWNGRTRASTAAISAPPQPHASSRPRISCMRGDAPPGTQSRVHSHHVIPNYLVWNALRVEHSRDFSKHCIRVPGPGDGRARCTHTKLGSKQSLEVRYKHSWNSHRTACLTATR